MCNPYLLYSILFSAVSITSYISTFRVMRRSSLALTPVLYLILCRYALLKSNQVDEASMTDLSRLVFKIIPYDKSEVIQMMYKLLYLESQLEGNQ